MNPISSFDIFDTCLVRKCGTPTSLFDLLANEAFNTSVSDDVKHGFILSRLNADYNNTNPRKNLNEIYANLDFHHPALLPIDKLVEKELQLEESMLSPVFSTFSIINNLRTKGHHIIFISDMYLPSKFIKKRLIDEQFWKDGDTLYVSNEIGLTKYDGSLFKHIAETENIKYQQWHHYGDNKHSDFIVPSALGIKCTLLQFNYSPYQKKWAETTVELQSRTGQLLAGLSRSVSLSEPVSDQHNIVLDIIAPLLVTFVCRIFSHAREHGIKHLYFCARDAQTAYFVAQHLNSAFPDVYVHYLYISQQALYTGDDGIKLVFFAHVGLASITERSAIVDIRSTGKSLKYINTLLTQHNYQPVYGYFLEMFCNGTATPDMPPYYCEIDYVYNRMNGNALSQSISAHWPLLEMFFSPHNDKKTAGYKVIDGVPQPFFSETNDGSECNMKDIDHVISIRKRLLEKYIKSFLSLKLHKCPDLCFNLFVIPTLAQFFHTPNRQYLKPLTSFYVRNEFSLKLEPYVEHMNFFSILHKKKGMAWRRASMIYSLPEWLGKLLYGNKSI